jgi:hypothetical protein
MGDPHGVFAHLTAPSTPAYRAVLEAFTAAKESFALQPHPEESRCPSWLRSSQLSQ